MSKAKSAAVRFDMEDEVSDEISFGETTTPSTGNFSQIVDDRLLVPKAGHKYRFRMLFFKDANSTRQTPFISKYNHTYRAKNENGEWFSDFAICPTTPYLEIANSWDKCKHCIAAGEVWNLYEDAKKEKSKDAVKYKRLYDNFKRRYGLFIPGLVLENTADPDTIHKVKILTLNSLNNFKTITSLIDNSGNKKAQYFNNFTNTNCFDLCFDVVNSENKETKTKFRDIQITFDKAKALVAKEWNDEKRLSFFTKHIEPLNFDADFYVQIDYDRLDTLYDTYVVPEMSNPPDEKSQSTSSGTEQNDKKKKRNSVGTELNKSGKTESTDTLDSELADIEALLKDDGITSSVPDPLPRANVSDEITDEILAESKASPRDDVVSTSEIDDILKSIDGI